MKAALVITPINNVNDKLEVIDNKLIKVIVKDWDDTVAYSDPYDQTDKLFECFVKNLSLSRHIVYNSNLYVIIHMLSKTSEEELIQFVENFAPKQYRIDCWIPVEADDPEIYTSYKVAIHELKHCQLMQPENIYKVVEIDE